MPDSPPTEGRELPKLPAWYIITLFTCFIYFIIGVLAFFSYAFITIISEDSKFLRLLSDYPLEMKYAVPMAKVYLGFTLTILSLLLFQLTTCVTSFRFKINKCLIYFFIASLVINLILCVVFFFIAGVTVKVIPLMIFLTTFGMALGIIKIL